MAIDEQIFVEEASEAIWDVQWIECTASEGQKNRNEVETKIKSIIERAWQAGFEVGFEQGKNLL